MNLIIMFIILSIINVVFSTIRSITTIKSGKTVASLISGGYFAFYNVMLIYTVMDFPMWEKCVITFGCNVVGVFTVKLVEQKMRKDRIWKLELTIRSTEATKMEKDLEETGIPFNYIPNVGKHTIFNVFASTQEETKIAHEIAKRYNAKTFASETKLAP